MYLTFEGQLLLTYLAILNLLAFLMCGLDKWKARRGFWRVPERVLFGLSFLGGGAAFFMGMHLFHHKTRHWSFRILIPLSILLWLGAVIYTQWKWGLWIVWAR